jgi:hypothetical protein
MDALYAIFQNFQLNLIQVTIAGMLSFVLGLWIGRIKNKKLWHQMAKMEKEILDLNAELLYSTKETKSLKVQR